MNNDDMTLAVLFKNVHQVMMAEDLLHEANLKCDLVPVPREISSECGLAMIIKTPYISDAMRLIESSEAVIVSTYKVVDGDYLPYDLTGEE